MRSFFFTKQVSPRKTVWFLTIITMTYLLFEFAYAAYIMEVMARQVTPDVIQQAEHLGRLISGFAVALLFWPLIVNRRFSIIIKTIMLVAITWFIMSAVYEAERLYIDSIVDESSVEQRMQASVGFLLRSALANDLVTERMLGGLWVKEHAQTASGIAFIGNAAALGAHSQLARKEMMAIAPDVVQGVVNGRNGGPEVEYQRFIKSQEIIEQKYANYKALHEEYAKEFAKSNKVAKQAWASYTNTLNKTNKNWGLYYKLRGSTGELVPPNARANLRKKLRQQGIAVSNNWKTGDYATFIKLAEAKHRSEVTTRRAAHLNGISADLSLERFSKSNEIQKLWRKSLHYPAAVKVILPITQITQQQFTASIYKPVLTARTRRQMDEYSSDYWGYVSSAEDGFMGEGLIAYEAMIAPFFALSLSLIGAFVHLSKSAFLITHAVTGWHLKSSIFKGLIIIFFVALVFLSASFFVSTPQTSHPTYQKWLSSEKHNMYPSGPDEPFEDFEGFENLSREEYMYYLGEMVLLTPKVLLIGVDTIIKIQTIAYPVFKQVKNGLPFALF